MKIFKRFLAITTLIVVAFVISYMVYTGVKLNA